MLDRFLAVLEQNPHKYVVRITGDCPLIHSPFIDRQIEVLHRYNADMVRLEKPSSVLEGQGVHSTRSLRHVAEQSNHPDDLEHVGSRYFSEQPELFRIVELQVPRQLIFTNMRLTVDEQNDYLLMSKLYENLYKGKPIPLEKVIAFLKNNPQFSTINQNVKHSMINQELASYRRHKGVDALAKVFWSMS